MVESFRVCRFSRVWILAAVVVALFHYSPPVFCSVLATDGDGEYKSYYKEPTDSDKQHVTPSSKDYGDLARQLTKDCTSDYQRIRAIYQWVCSNIAYDTTYKIYTADECFEQCRGVCQAYCELFYQLAKAVDVKVEIISGDSRDSHGTIDKGGHSWLFAYTDENRGILLDPTWGAGTVDGNAFVRSENCWKWFCVDAEWMILTHLPKDKQYQLIDKTLSMKEFRALPPVSDLWPAYGLDVHDIYQKARDHTLALPMFYTKGEGDVEILELPESASLRIGQLYTFRIRMKSDRAFTLINNSIFCKQDEWKAEGDNVYSIMFMPRDTMSLALSLRDRVKSYWNHFVKYAIEPPTQADWDEVEKHYPLSTPDVKGVRNLMADKWMAAGVDGQRMLSLIRQYQVTELPLIHDSKGQKLTIVSVPMRKKLKAGEPCLFKFYPKSGVKWALVNNEKWFTDWQQSEDGMLSMSMTPAEPGPLCLYVQMVEGESYWSCLEYDVE